MSLHYRGVAYDSIDAPVDAVDTAETIGHYRGATWKIHPAQAVQPKRSDVHLQYRGARVN